MPPRSRPAPMTTAGAGTVSPVPPESDWFPARVVTAAAGPPAAYTFVERWVDATGTLADKAYGRQNTATDPAYAIDGSTFAVGDTALCRRGPGAGGLSWELLRLAAGTAGSTPCPACAWLQSGPHSNKSWRIRVDSAVGLCEPCTTIDPPFDDTTPANNRFAVWTESPGSGQDTWDVLGEFVLCGGCATARILTDRRTSTSSPFDRAKLELTYRSTATGDLVVATFPAECCSVTGTVSWIVAADDLCPVPADGNYPCASYVRIVAECVACGLTNSTCAKCLEGQGPAVLVVDGGTSGFSGVNELYNGRWFLKPSGDCTYSATCGCVAVTAVIDCHTITVTYGLAASPPPGCPAVTTAVYVYDTGGLPVHCLDSTSQTATADPGNDPATTPGTVSVSPRSCTRACDLTGLNITFPGSCGAGGGTAVTDATMFADGVAMQFTQGPGDSACSGFGIRVYCLGDGQFLITPVCGSATCGTGYVCYSGGPTMVVGNEATTPGQILLTFNWAVDCCGSTDTVTIIIKNF